MTRQYKQIAAARRRELKQGFLLCAAGIVLNLAFAFLMHLLRLPPFLDTVGTILCAALGGYLPGIIVGFATNILEGLLFHPIKLYFTLIDMLIAITAALFARRDFFSRPKKTALAALVFFAIKVGIGSPLAWLLNNSDIGGAAAEYAQFFHAHGFGRLSAHLTADILHNALDMTLTALLVYFVLGSLFRPFRRSFGEGIWRTAELSEVAGMGAKQRVSRGLSLRTKVVFSVSICMLVITGVSIIVSFRLFNQAKADNCVEMARVISKQAAKVIDPERIDEYIEQGAGAPGYQDVERRLAWLRETYPDVEYLYVYQIREDGCHVVFDIDTPELEGMEPGEIVEFDKSFLPYVPDLLAGKQIPPIASNDSFGALLTVYQPVYDEEGVCRCYVGLDYSADMLSMYGAVFIVKLVALLLGFFIIVVAAGLRAATNNIIVPIDTMAYCAGAFAYDSEEARAANVERIRALNIYTGDEIENLYLAFLKTVEDSMNYVENLLHARTEVEEMKEQVSVMDELAYKDALTGVRNKTSYDQYMEKKIAVDIAEGTAAFGVIMIDLNYLKRVNDTYGHERGNIYLKECCAMVCSVFDHSPVFRVGGDEFVVVIEQGDLENRDALLARFQDEMKKRADSKLLEPWEKVSTAVGVAVYDPAVDKNGDDVFKRADKAMYANKLAMKAVRTD